MPIQFLRNNLPPAVRGSLYYLTFFLCMGSFGPYLNVYYQELGMSGQQIGILSTFFPLMSVGLATPLSALADRKGWRIQILQVAILGASVFVFFMQFSAEFIWLALMLLGMAVFAAPIMSIADGLIVNMAAEQNLNYGGMRLWGSIGIATGAAFFGWVWQKLGFSLMFGMGAALFFPIFLIGSSLDPGQRDDAVERQSVMQIFTDSGLVLLIAIAFFMGVSDGIAQTFQGLYVIYLGGNNTLIGLLIGLSAVSEILTMQFSQKIAQRLNDASTLTLALSFLAIAHGGFGLAQAAWVLLPLAVFKGLGFGLFFPNIVRIVNDRAPKKWVTTAQSLRAVAMFGLAPLLAGPFGGFVYDLGSPRWVFLTSFIALGLAVTLVGLTKLKRILL